MQRKMWWMLALVVAAAVLVGCQCEEKEQAATEEIDPYAGAHFKRVTLVVADIDRALTLYRDVLGFEAGEPSESSAESYSYPVFDIDPEAKIRFVTLSAGKAQVRTLGLTEVKGMELPDRGNPHMTATVLRTEDIERDFAKIEEMGLHTEEAKFVELTETYHFWERAFVDVDGHLVVLYEVVQMGEGD